MKRIELVGFPFDNESEEIQDRNISSDTLAYGMGLLYNNGVFPHDANNLKVVPATGMSVTIKAGSILINGRIGILNEDAVLDIEPSTNLNRIDRVVAILDKSDRTVVVYASKGTPAGSPVAPPVVRQGDVHEMSLATINIVNNTLTIPSSSITDTRLDTKVCGIVVQAIDKVDTTLIFDQYDNYLKEKIAEWNSIQQEQILQWRNQITSQKNEYAALKKDMDSWYSDIRTAVFAKMQLNFDNWLYMPGQTRKTRFNSDGSVRERIANTLTDKTFCERITTFPSDGVIIENVICSEFELNMVKTTRILVNGDIDEEITGTVGLLEPSGTGGITLHNLLSNLGFENSGHVGFAAASDVEQIRRDLLGVKENLQSALKVLNGGV